MTSAPDGSSLSSDQDTNQLNSRSLIQPLETLPVELTGTHFSERDLEYIVGVTMCVNGS